MGETEKLNLLQYYRHDLMNELQLVQGYLHMGKTDKAKQKVNNWINDLNEERKLMNLNAPQFVVWMIMFNHVHNHIRLSYSIHLQKSLHHIDPLIVIHCKAIVQTLKNNLIKSELYNIHIDLSENTNSKIVFKLYIEGNIEEKENAIEQLKIIGNRKNINLNITKDNSAIICIWEYSI